LGGYFVSRKSYYPLQKWGNIFLVQAAFGSQDNDLVVTAKLIVDTGASYTVISNRLMRTIAGVNATPLRQENIVTASQRMTAPVIAVPWMNCLGMQIDEFPTVALTLPTNTMVDGLLGVDFMKRCKAVIDIDRAEIVVPDFG
jgi:predicted aspartyl protease